MNEKTPQNTDCTRVSCHPVKNKAQLYSRYTKGQWTTITNFTDCETDEELAFLLSKVRFSHSKHYLVVQ